MLVLIFSIIILVLIIGLYIYRDRKRENLQNYGLCPDKLSTKEDTTGSNCPKCVDGITAKTDSPGTNCGFTNFIQGVYIKGNDIGTFRNSTPKDCKDKCAADPKCVAFSMDESSTCFLKNKFDNLTYDTVANTEAGMAKWNTSFKAPYGSCPNEGYAPIVRKFDQAGSNCSTVQNFEEYFRGIDFPGNNIVTYVQKEKNDYSNEMLCQYLCTATPGCKGYSYDKVSKICSVKNKMANKVSNPSVNTSFVRNFGMCPDGNKPKQDNLGGQCYGYCENSDVFKIDAKGSNCNSKEKYALCPDKTTIKKDATGTNCFEPCENDASIWKTDKAGTNCFGMCETGNVLKKNETGSNCPPKVVVSPPIDVPLYTESSLSKNSSVQTEVIPETTEDKNVLNGFLSYSDYPSHVKDYFRHRKFNATS